MPQEFEGALPKDEFATGDYLKVYDSQGRERRILVTSTALAEMLNSAETAHAESTDNPHGVTKTQVGLGNCDNTSDANKPVSTAQQAAIDAHATLTSNPHSVTKTQVGLGNCDNTSDVNKPVSTAQQTAINNTRLKTSSAADPTTTEYPNDRDQGLHHNTTSGIRYWVRNDGGTIYKVALS